jgi:hypothetical protein
VPLVLLPLTVEPDGFLGAGGRLCPLKFSCIALFVWLLEFRRFWWLVESAPHEGAEKTKRTGTVTSRKYARHMAFLHRLVEHGRLDNLALLPKGEHGMACVLKRMAKMAL